MANGKKHNIITLPGSSDVEVRKSHFLCALKQVRSEEEARAFIEEIRRKHYDNVFERSGDDGEPQGTAGKPMLEILKGADIYDVCAVVTRYFGGTLLGTGGLVRAYSDALKEGLAASEISELTNGVELRLSCDYSLAEKVRRLVANLGIHTLNEEYGADCTLTYLVRLDAEADFKAKLTELSNGRLVPERVRELLFADGSRPMIY